jgi:hypothetical protein
MKVKLIQKYNLLKNHKIHQKILLILNQVVVQIRVLNKVHL